MSLVLDAEQAAKPATKRRRQRSPSPPAPRKKSCEACRKAKARCNNALPVCSRCERKGVPCSYEGTRNEDRMDQADEIMRPSSSNMALDPLLDAPGEYDGLVPRAFDAFEMLDFSFPVEASGGAPPQNSTVNEGSPDGGREGSSSDQSINGSNDGHGYQSSLSSSHSWEALDAPKGVELAPARNDHSKTAAASQKAYTHEKSNFPFRMVSRYNEDGSKVVEINANDDAGDTWNPRFFGFDRKWPASCSLSVNHILSAFRQWPQKMVKCDDMPSFIHPHFPSMEVSDNAALTLPPLGRKYLGLPPKLPESLAHCSSICTMFFNKTPENAPFVWQNIKREQERIYDNFRSWTPRQCLSGYQAMLVYSFLRMIEGEQEYNNFDMAFLITVGEVGASISNHKLQAYQARIVEPEEITWSDWIFSECAARTSIVFFFMFIMAELYKVIPPNPGCKGIGGVALPCNRRMWMATSKADWQAEYKAYRDSRKSKRVLTFADLRYMREDEDHKLTADERADIESWSRDLDEFGNLVLIAGLSGHGTQLTEFERVYNVV